MHSVFLVEDEYLEIEALEMILSRQVENIEIVGKAASGDAALRGIRAAEPDIVIMDINIPGINGIEVLKQIKSERPHIIVILITAYSEFEYAYQALKAKADDFLLKPIRPEQLTEALEKSIRSLKSNVRNIFDEKMNEVLYAVIQKRYSDTREAVTHYIEAVYRNYERDLIAAQKEIRSFTEELNKISQDLCSYNIKRVIDERMNQQYFIKHYQNGYDLKVDIMTVIDHIFDHLMRNENTMKNSIEDIINFVDRNAYKDISLDSVGEYANMSSYYLSKIFKRKTGMNFVAYLTEKKMEMAKDMLLNTEEPIINIAMNLSYHEPNYFSKVFKKSTGMTPMEYRKSHKHKTDETESAE